MSLLGRSPARLVGSAAALGLSLAVALGLGTFLALKRASFALTNPPGYHHPAAGSVLQPVAVAPASAPEREVSFPTTGGATLRGTVSSGEGPAATTAVGIVAVHGRARDRGSMLEQAQMLRALGYTTLRFDLREHGLSDGAGRGMSLGYREAQDVGAAARYMKDTLGVRRVVVLGQSLGGSSAILAAVQDETIDAVISESAVASFNSFVFEEADRRVRRLPLQQYLPRWPLRWWSRAVVAYTERRVGASGLPAPFEVIGQLGPRPLLLMHGTGDHVVEAGQARLLFDVAAEPKELWLADGAPHVGLHQTHPDEYRRRVAAFLARVAQS